MNSSILFGGITFVCWALFSSWYYTCEIKGLCDGGEVVDEVMVAPETVMVAEENPEPEVEEEPILEAIVLRKEDILFQLNSITLSDETSFNSFARNARDQTQEREVMIEVVGYTCDLGSASYNLQLGKRRADEVKRRFMESGFEESSILSRSLGEENPRVENQSEASRSQNRRVEIMIKTTDQ